MVNTTVQVRESPTGRDLASLVVALPPVPQKEPYLLDENGIDEIDILPPVQFSLCVSHPVRL